MKNRAEKVRLNIGCGFEHLEGWVNIDKNPGSAADRLMQAWDLDFPDNSVSEIRAVQLVEHLGFFRAAYFLSECWRVLRPGGSLLLETPDIERTFRIFLAGGRAEREAALGWVYGAETPGMGHVYCFPAELLKEMLAGAGFSAAAAEEFLYQPSRPALRLKAVKAGGETAALAAALRRRLLDKGLADTGREEYSAALEQAVKELSRSGGNPEKALAQALVSAPAVLEYFALEEENDHHPSPEALACAKLAGAGLQGRLALEYSAASGSGLDHAAAFKAAMGKGLALLADALAGRELPAAPGAEGFPPVFSSLAAAAWLAEKRAADLHGGRKI
jgi:SAM-dependent methyltransferase